MKPYVVDKSYLWILAFTLQLFSQENYKKTTILEREMNPRLCTIRTTSLLGSIPSNGQLFFLLQIVSMFIA